MGQSWAYDGPVSMTLEKLRYFLILAEELNFTRAAARVYITQQAFSTHIKQLEGMLAVSLFERTTHGVRLTAAGQQLLEPVRNALTLLSAGFDEARALGGSRNKLRIGGAGILYGGEVGSLAIAAFSAEHPEVNIEIHELRWEDPSCGLREGQVDLAFVRPPFDTSGLILRELFSEPVVLAVSSKHPFAGRTEVSLEEALAEPLVLARNTPPQWDDFWLLCEQRGGRPRCTATAGSTIEEIETVAAGLASSVCPLSLARVFAHHPDVRFLRIVEGPMSVVALAWRDKGLSSMARAFIDTVDQVVAGTIDRKSSPV